MPTIVDVRGLACPQPVIQTRKALQTNAGEVITIVDNDTSQHNVTKMAEKQGYIVRSETQADGIYLYLTPHAPVAHVAEQVQPVISAAAPTGALVLVVPDEFMGRGDPELGGILMRAFFHTLGEVQPLPDTIIFFNSGVKLLVEGSKTLADLLSLQDAGMQMLACGTCLGHYGLKELVRVGEISNMYTIAETLLRAGKVINL